MKTISKSELRNIVTGQEKGLVINVLPETQYRRQHIPNSINIPVKDNERFVEDVSARAGSKHARVVVYCANKACDLSEKALKKLKNAGFTNVSDYAEGTEGWFENYPSKVA